MSFSSPLSSSVFHYRNDETISKLLDMVTTLMHNQMMMQNDIQKLREEVFANHARIEELENIYVNDSGSTLVEKRTKKQKLSLLAKQFIPSKTHQSFLQHVKNSITQSDTIDFTIPTVQLVDEIMREFEMPLDNLAEKEQTRRDAWYRIKLTQKIENHKRELKKVKNTC